MAIATLIAVSALVAPAATLTICAMLVSIAFIAISCLRLSACAASVEAKPQLRPLEGAELPIYSIVIALYREARIVPQLLAALGAINYPHAKLDLKFVIEEDDAETLAALMRAGHLPGSEVILAPSGTPRTKPRALNVALPLLRGRFVAKGMQLASVADLKGDIRLRRISAPEIDAFPGELRPAWNQIQLNCGKAIDDPPLKPTSLLGSIVCLMVCHRSHSRCLCRLLLVMKVTAFSH